jgi:hypothetical protein
MMTKLIRRVFFEEQWFIAFSLRQKQNLFQQRAEDFWQITPPPRHFYADPFLFTWKGKDYVFFEDFEYQNRKGAISCIAVNGAGSWTAAVKVLEREYHLSYPCVFEWENEIYMIPETSKRHTIELYKAVEFPLHWKFEKVLLEGVIASDNTLFKALDGKFWLLSSIGAVCDSLGPLYAFISESPVGGWASHRLNPIVLDSLRSRPAGQLFWHEGNLFRPSQDCSVVYGGTIILNRIDAMSEEAYTETPIAVLDPKWLPGSSRTHTINRSDQFEVRDALRYVRRQDWVKTVSRFVSRPVGHTVL